MLRIIKNRSRWAVVGLAIFGLSCGGEADQADRFDVDVVTDGTELEDFETDQGYFVELTTVSMRVELVEFTVGGEKHASSSVFRRVVDRLVSPAHAHPNHEAGGEVGGELPGPTVLTWNAGDISEAGVGSFLEGDYAGYNLVVSGERTDDDGLAAGLMARVEGTFDTGDGSTAFVAEIDAPDAADVYGGRFDAEIPGDDSEAVGLRLRSVDDWSGNTLFDGVEFSQLPTDDDGVARIDSDELEAHVFVRESLLAHEFYDGGWVDESGS